MSIPSHYAILEKQLVLNLRVMRITSGHGERHITQSFRPIVGEVKLEGFKFGTEPGVNLW